ncbi:12-oxophytodienoate reductase [Paenibacillus sp. 32O-W]|uniref:12-oxophytodienoate reductase n=1 Tax=Paenibacillus cisolokensis TaxID=1658519 RepID=A0ABQ4N478_9BACL|nr:MULTISPECIES: NADH:flavin oxidoreductase [Paenibacillus]ALS28012.1 12-oxophytodienoate reductase [Paenibacillus sp. 32O-W]GIQ62982.1 12-oxophytodienoate reductase [Paenibacillus cisolokensis]
MSNESKGNASAIHPSVQPLFKPFSIGKLTLPNRIVMAPMTRSFSPNGMPGPNVAQYYRRRAENGVGLIITEGTVINHPSSADDPNVPQFYGPALEGWSSVVEQVHAAGGLIFPQLWHVGMARKVGSPPNPESLPIGPSGIDLSGNQVTVPMTESEILSVIEAFAQAATDAKLLGFDGIEIHGAHGYLIDQFFWKQTNQRSDRYGGDSFEGRTRFAAEVIRSIRKAVGPDFPIILRLSQWKTSNYSAKLAETPKQLASFLESLTAAGVDIYHCSTRRYWEPEFEGSDLNLAGWVKALTGRPTITVGSVGLNEELMRSFASGQVTQVTSLNGLIERLERNEFDLVAVGRSLLVDPEWAMKIRNGRFNELKPFIVESLRTLS